MSEEERLPTRQTSLPDRIKMAMQSPEDYYIVKYLQMTVERVVIKLEKTKMTIDYGEGFGQFVLSFTKDSFNNLPEESLPKPFSILGIFHGLVSKFTEPEPGFDMRKWFDYLRDIIISTHIALDFGPGVECFSFEIIKRFLHGMGVSEIIIPELNNEYFRKILYEYPAVKYWVLAHEGPRDDEIYKEIMRRDTFHLCLQPNCKISLDDVSNCNIVNLEIWYTPDTSNQLSQKDLNTFLKNWINGSNPNMKSLSIKMEFEELDFEFTNNVLAGINYTDAPNYRKRKFPRSFMRHTGTDKDFIEYKGGYDFFRKDGLRGTIFYALDDSYGDLASFRFIVWPNFR
ncbi:hypothetical protein GCK72_010916 [Caenorhabditis remanei]|uniref:Sdz-33 F-box domain-containing protein n=1 Tax=Caenorhabditis remanei TaxID=31234 RepID=A0A6A5H796_CAERE|nr:hypothetical protein GCK72_010916 [Caenorhabditis remanei]KAF1762654.1 hypothetical protein GCK72_010916 [Caenorhabditis remanei]